METNYLIQLGIIITTMFVTLYWVYSERTPFKIILASICSAAYALYYIFFYNNSVELVLAICIYIVWQSSMIIIVKYTNKPVGKIDNKNKKKNDDLDKLFEGL